MNERNAPFTTLGKHLKYVREQLDQSLAEVSGAVEIDEESLQRIESGHERPAEDILLLLISHFGMQDQEAVQLWELAGYDGDAPDQLKAGPDFQPGSKSMVMLLALDTRIIYSDGIIIDANKAGLTLNFTQASGQSQALPVARIGMSYDQAEQVLLSLQSSLLKARYNNGPRALPPSGDNTDTKS